MSENELLTNDTSSIVITASVNTSSTVVFGRSLSIDSFNFVTQTENDTVVITPRYNTSGLTELKVGVLLPFSQKNDNLTAEIVWGGLSAIRMAANTINQLQLIPGAYVTLIQKDSFPNQDAGDQRAITEAVYASVTLLQQGVIAVIGDVSSSWTTLSALMTSTLEIPQCSFTANAVGFSDKSQYKYFYRTIPTKTTMAGTMLDFASTQNWINVGVIYSNDMLGQQFYQKIMNLAGYKKNINVIGYEPFSPDDITGLLEYISSSTAMRIILVAVTGSDQIALLKEAAKMDLLSDQYVWLLMDDNTSALFDSFKEDDRQLLDGLFMFDMKTSLYGYPPFEDFLNNWVKLDPRVYPYAGKRNISTNEGPAYSCMMTLARGFNRTLSNLGNHTLGLELLLNRSLGASMTPLTFDTGYIGPDGPLRYDSNGDLLTGNHRIYNIQKGNRVTIGHSIAGNLQLTNLPVFHDGSFQPPTDSPPSRALNPTFSSPVSQGILVFTSTFILLSSLVLMMVIVYRKHAIFRASSPLFCCLELLGFIFTYISVIFMLGIPTNATCFIVPISFTLGFLLVLGNLIAKNYRIYRIFNNIFISKTVITDSKLMRSTSAVVSLDMIILIIGLVVTQPNPKLVKLSPTSHYWVCEADSSITKTVFLVVETCYAAAMLAFATFLAYKTRSAGKSYDRYNECKQMGISVYNILFSAIVGFTALVNPLANYYTKFYFGAIATLWATTFSFAILFIPKVYLFYKQWGQKKTAKKQQELNQQERQLIKQQQQVPHDLLNSTSFSFSTDQTTTITSSNNTEEPIRLSFLKSYNNNSSTVNHHGPTAESILLYGNTGDDTLIRRNSKGSELIELSASYSNDRYDDTTNVYVEVQEGYLPIRKAFRYFPFLSQWKMRKLMVFPRLGYISYYSEKSRKGTMISYSHASVHTSNLEAYVIKIHGKDVHDVYIQFCDFDTMELWQACLNQDIMKEITRHHSSIFVPSPTVTTDSSEMTITHDITTSSTIKEKEEDDEFNNSLSPRYIPGRRRSKSHPSILSDIDTENLSFQQQYPLLFSSLFSVATESSDMLSSYTIKRRKTCSDYYGD